MSLIKRFIPAAWRARAIEALGGSAFGSYSADDDPQLYGMRRISDTVQHRDLNQMSHQQMLKVAHHLYESNMLGGGVLVDQRVDVALGGKALDYAIAFDPKLTNMSEEEAQSRAAGARRILDKTWNHPTHNLGVRGRDYVTTLLVQGHLIQPIVSTNPVDGSLQLDYVDAALLEKVLAFGANTAFESSMAWESVILKPRDGAVGDGPRLRIVRFDTPLERYVGPPPRDTDAPAEGTAPGDRWCFYFRMSRLLNASRGRSVFLRPADFLDGLDQYLWTQLDRSQSGNASLWDVTLKNAQPQDVKARAAEIRKDPPNRPLTVMVHSDSEEWKFVQPDLKATDAVAGIRIYQNLIAGHLGVPEAWYGSGSDTNRATLEGQNDVTLRQLEALQDLAVQVLTAPLLLAYDNLALLQPKMFPARSTGGVKIGVNLPPLSEKDATRAGAALVQTEAALEAAVEREFVSRKSARRIFCTTLKHAGGELDPEVEAEQITAERETRATEDAEKANAAARDAADKALADEPDDQVAPAPRGPKIAAPAQPDVQSTILNGAQIQAATAIVISVATGEIPRDSGVAQLTILLRLSKEDAERMMGTAGTGARTTPNVNPLEQDAAPSKPAPQAAPPKV